MASNVLTVAVDGQETTAAFWRRHAANMCAKNKAICDKIAEALEDDWGIADAESMSALYLHDIHAVIEAAGGKAKWALAIEHRLPTPFRRQPIAGVPPSAALVVPSAGSTGDPPPHGSQPTAGASAKYKVGAKIVRDGAIAATPLDPKWLDACLFATVKPKEQTLHKDEKAAILHVIYNWRIKNKSV